MELSKTSYVLLGMLRLGCQTGYEIKSFVDVSTRFFWAASYGQIYPELARLEELGLVDGRRDNSNGRRRKSYELTAAGERALDEWLTSPEPLHFELRHEGVLKLFFSDALPAPDRAAQIARMRAEHERVADQLRSIEPGARAAAEEHGEEMPLAVLEFGVAYQDFIAGWCERLERAQAATATDRS